MTETPIFDEIMEQFPDLIDGVIELHTYQSGFVRAVICWSRP